MLAALIRDNTVVEIRTINESDLETYNTSYQNVIVIDDLNPKPNVGWKLEGNTLTANGVDPYANELRITKLAFRNRLTTAELFNLYTQLNTNVMLRIIQDNLNVATFVDLSRPDTIAAVQYLVSLGILTSDRAVTVLTTLPTDIERYRPA